MKKPDASKIKRFQKKVWNYYEKEGRHDLPWRKTHDPYRILVSEMMLQQTQVDRVVPKYRAFLKEFPTARALARASAADVLKLWSGLGYNRRALFLKRAAETVVSEFGGKFPKDAETLETLPGVGPYTARAVATFSYGASYTFIETNIRSVFICEFFPKTGKVPDEKLFPFIEASVPKDGTAREWYYALMDYGVHLKKTMPNPNRNSAHYAKQSAFEGSLRQIRGAVLRRCMTDGPLTSSEIVKEYGAADKVRAKGVIRTLIAEGFLDTDSERRVKIKNS